MIEALRELGRLALEGEHKDFLESLVLQVTDPKNVPHIVFINFDTRSSSFALEINEIDERVLTEYLWVGNADGANSPQWYVTTDNPEYLLSQTIPNLIAKLPEESSLKKDLKHCWNIFYEDLGKQKGPEERFRYIFNVKYIDSAISTGEIYKQKAENIKATLTEVTKVFYDYLKNQVGLTKKEARLFSLLINGTPIAFNEEYRKLVAYEKVDVFYAKPSKGVCGACGLLKPVTSNTTRLKFKYYITDKINFAHGLDKSFTTNLTLCSECYKQLLAAETLVMKYLSVRIGAGAGGLSLYIIPQFLFDFKLKFNSLENWLKNIKFNFETMNTFDQKLTNLEEKLESHRERKAEDDNYILNFLFYQKSQAELRVLNLIQDVPPSRLTAIKEVVSEVYDLGSRLLGESRNWILDFNKIYYLFPPKIDKKANKAIQYREILNIFESIFTGQPLDYNLVMKEFLELIQLYHYDRYEQYKMVNLKEPDGQLILLVLAVLRANLFLVYARKLGIMSEGGVSVDVTDWHVDESIKDYVREVGFNECQAGLFLLGYLLGEVANAQYNENKKTKPVLEKLNYQGMDLKRIQILSLEIFEKLQQYKKLDSQTENIHALFKKIMDKHSTKWPLNHIENVFYILSGYSFNTYRIIRKAAEKKEK